MFRRIVRTAGIIAIIAFFAFSWFSPRGGPAIGQRAPLLMGTLLNGDAYELEEGKGTVTVIDFWATWCPPCVKSLPALQILHERYVGDPRIQIVSVNLDDGSRLKARLKSFLTERAYDFPVILDVNKGISRAYGVQTIPTMVVVDGSGLVHTVKVGLFANDPKRIVDHVVATINDAAQ